MKYDILTIAVIESLILITQIIVLFVQYKVNQTYRGIGWWVLGSTLMALGVILMPMIYVSSLEIMARFANPLVVLGQIFLYIGIVHFLDKKENRWLLITIFAVFIFSYYYNIYINNSISARSVVVNTTLAVITLMTAYENFSKKNRFISISANFTGVIFLFYGCYLMIRTIITFIMPSIQTYSDQKTFFMVAFIVPTITSTLWTFGLIIMFNQRLNIENQIEKEKDAKGFNTSPDAAMITRLDDGLIIDVNEGFSGMTGYTHEEVIENSTLKINLWQNKAEREIFLTELNKKGMCKNMEFIFARKDGSQFVGMISARVIAMYDVPHIITSIQDITERKLAEQKIQGLIQQLEIERNAAQKDSITDSLTGIANRRYFDVTLRTEFYRLRRSGAILSLIMLDIDFFKKFNDNYGHLAGDKCLSQLGTLLNTVVKREQDIVARYGGEEFVVILPATEVNGAKILAEQIRKTVEELAIPHATSDIGKYVTVSVGVVTVYTTGFDTPEQVIALADEALYCAKKNGRNRVEVKTNE